MGLVLPLPGDMSAGGIVNDDDALPPGAADDDEGWDCDTAVRTDYVLQVTSPVSLLTQTSFTTHFVQYIQYTLSVHFILL